MRARSPNVRWLHPVCAARACCTASSRSATVPAGMPPLGAPVYGARTAIASCGPPARVICERNRSSSAAAGVTSPLLAAVLVACTSDSRESIPWVDSRKNRAYSTIGNTGLDSVMFGGVLMPTLEAPLAEALAHCARSHCRTLDFNYQELPGSGRARGLLPVRGVPHRPPPR